MTATGEYILGETALDAESARLAQLFDMPNPSLSQPQDGSP
jgi:hypothetical protein